MTTSAYVDDTIKSEASRVIGSWWRGVFIRALPPLRCGGSYRGDLQRNSNLDEPSNRHTVLGKPGNPGYIAGRALSTRVWTIDQPLSHYRMDASDGRPECLDSLNMNSPADKHEAFLNYLEEQGGELDGEPSEKILERMEPVDDPERPDWLVLDVERHRAVLGTRYTPGEPMYAYITYWPRYAYHPQTKTLEYLGQHRQSQADIDYELVADIRTDELTFNFEPAGDGRHRCREGWSNEERLVSDVADIETMAAKIVRRLNYEDYVDVLAEHADEATRQQIMDQFYQALEKKAQERARRNWERYLAGYGS